MSEDTLKAYQKQVDDWTQLYATPYWSPLSNLASLMEEVGELARILNHSHGDKIKKATENPDDLEGEFGDILFCLICIANSLDIDLDKAIQKAIHKSATRDKDRFPKKPAS